MRSGPDREQQLESCRGEKATPMSHDSQPWNLRQWREQEESMPVAGGKTMISRGIDSSSMKLLRFCPMIDAIDCCGKAEDITLQ